MLCPCCGSDLGPQARDCDCGARFVGEPLDHVPFKVQRLGPVMLAVGLLVLAVGASLIFTKWLAFAAILVVWSSSRARRLALLDPEGYGGYRTATAILVSTSLASVIAAGYAVAYIPEYIQLRKERQLAATRANAHYVHGLLEKYKRKYGSYPSSLQALKSISDEALPTDYWEKNFSYLASTDGIASDRIPVTGLNFNNFELRSAGPDEKMGTSDDIIMRDGIFITASEAKDRPVSQGVATR